MKNDFLCLRFIASSFLYWLLFWTLRFIASLNMKKTLLYCIQYNKHLLRVIEIISFDYFSLLVLFHIDVCFARLALSLLQVNTLNMIETFLQCSQYNKHLLQNTKLQLKNHHIKAVIFFSNCFRYLSRSLNNLLCTVRTSAEIWRWSFKHSFISNNPANIQYINEMIMIIFQSRSQNGGMAVNHGVPGLRPYPRVLDKRA